MNENLLSILSGVRKNDIYPSFYFKFPKCIRDVVLFKLVYAGQSTQYKNAMACLYLRTLGRDLPFIIFQHQTTAFGVFALRSLQNQCGEFSLLEVVSFSKSEIQLSFNKNDRKYQAACFSDIA